jgi:hypothetical protein
MEPDLDPPSFFLGGLQCCGAQLFVSALAPTFKKFRLWLRLELCGYLFSQLLNENVDFLRLLGKNIYLIYFFDPIQYEL